MCFLCLSIASASVSLFLSRECFGKGGGGGGGGGGGRGERLREEGRENAEEETFNIKSPKFP